ncbi:FAD-binding domain-containing protein [Patellaria atrata CBS 101060]|uniref:FAD-binding domain-containing protein n=1 Tax=Patellaria atrata CBS 101060 TaxID=1346257 RepID=A0A9P4SFK6_9PEZI|nr:FAD-binding domain-containing protein [Patellaria atrata CBS 101060]
MSPSSLFSSACFLTIVTRAVLGTSETFCKRIPGDADWPGLDAWSQLDRQVDGRLIAAFPLAHVCHDPTYSETACTRLQQGWGFPDTMVPQPAEFMATWFQNQSCTPFTPKSTPCNLGNHVSYSVNVSSVQDVAKGLAFAQRHRIRVVIKNSGHDFYGKSTGKGGLGLWVHHLKHKQIIPRYRTSYYQGPAIKIGAGVSGGEASAFASQRGYRIVTGSCPTVKTAGGYSQGGGHSYLTGLYGFGADNVLEWEVVTASGDHVVASPVKNRELYWALSGGGGGSYGVVVSMTARIFPDGQIAIASMSFSATSVGGVDAYWDAVSVFHTQLQPLVDAGMVAQYIVTNDTLSLFGMMAPGFTGDELTTVMQPMMTALSKDGLATDSSAAMNLVVAESNSYYDLYAAKVMPLMAENSIGPVVSGRFVSRENMATNASAVNAALRTTTGNGRFIVAITALNATGPSRIVDPIASNAMQPAFKEAFMSLIIAAPWNSRSDPWAEAAVLQDELHSVIRPVLESATPGTGVYMNEGNWQQPGWQDVFYGSTYERLLQIKKRYDPEGVFYGLTAVGSEAWAQDANGRLCRTDT